MSGDSDSQFGWRGTFRDRQKGGGKARKVTPKPQGKENLGDCPIQFPHFTAEASLRNFAKSQQVGVGQIEGF